jgi:hypothetical protein
MTPYLQLKTLFLMRTAARGLTDSQHRFVSTAEVNARPAPFFVLIRGTSDVAWGVRDDVRAEIASELDRLAGEEPPIADFEAPPLHADAYLSLVDGQASSGPAFRFPDEIAQPADVRLIDRIELLERHFRGWTAEEIPWRTPIVAIMHDGYPVSVCFCATVNSKAGIEAGVETAADFRRRGFAARVTAAWARAIQASGRIPLYSTNWQNIASRGVARKLGLIQYANDWSLVPNP